MNEQNNITESYIAEYAEQYMEKIFYFCLKKMGNCTEAEDLTSEISLCVFTQLRRNVIPKNFPAWVWQIARNRYSKWADAKHRRTEAETDTDIGGVELADDSDIENEFVRSEELSLLRRELAFILSGYRDVVVAYYIDDNPVREIAAHLKLTVEAVKKRLIRARKILKEGMDMAREFGKRSYNPEKINLTASGNQPSGLPWRAVERKAPVNILCEASNNLCTVEELATALGIAVPYMEDEVKILVKSELLTKTDDGKYVTNFFICPKECKTEINSAICDCSEKVYDKIWELAGCA